MTFDAITVDDRDTYVDLTKPTTPTWGTEAQKKNYMEPLLSGDKRLVYVILYPVILKLDIFWLFLYMYIYQETN